jgi:hypothetical protein
MGSRLLQVFWERENVVVAEQDHRSGYKLIGGNPEHIPLYIENTQVTAVHGYALSDARHGVHTA